MLIQFLMFSGSYHFCYNFCNDRLKNNTPKNK